MRQAVSALAMALAASAGNAATPRLSGAGTTRRTGEVPYTGPLGRQCSTCHRRVRRVRVREAGRKVKRWVCGCGMSHD